MPKFGIFYIPNKKLVKEIITIKKFFGDLSPINHYIDHPVHLSIYVFETRTKDIGSVIESFSNLNSQLKKTKCKFNGWDIFEKDTLTSGFNTLYLSIESKMELHNIQMKVVEQLKKYHIKKNSDFHFENDFKTSFDNYGYPFVGRHWIPHITIGSLKLKTSEIKNLLKSIKLSFNETSMDSLELFLINHNHHDLIKKIKF